MTGLVYVETTKTIWTTGKLKRIAVYDPRTPANVTKYIKETSQLGDFSIFKLHQVRRALHRPRNNSGSLGAALQNKPPSSGGRYGGAPHTPPAAPHADGSSSLRSSHRALTASPTVSPSPHLPPCLPHQAQQSDTVVAVTTDRKLVVWKFNPCAAFRTLEGHRDWVEDLILVRRREDPARDDSLTTQVKCETRIPHTLANRDGPDPYTPNRA